MTPSIPRSLPTLAREFAQGSITSREACAEAGVGFGDLLIEMAHQKLQLPRTPVPDDDRAKLAEALGRAMSEK